MQEVHFTDDPSSTLARSVAKLSAEGVLFITTASRRHLDVVSKGLEAAVHIFDRAKVHVPAETVEAAEAVADELSPDVIVTLGGGAATGLGKALRLTRDVGFIAIPTTYSASERTTIFGITSGVDKRTGRDERVRPDVVIYAPQLTTKMPLGMSVQSLMNALAHPVSALSTGTLEEGARLEALEAIGLTTDALESLLKDPQSVGARRDAFHAAARAGDVIERGALGAHHRIAHFLGGRFGLPHAPVHSLLLPQTLSSLRETDAGTLEAICEAAGDRALSSTLFDLLKASGGQTSLSELGVEAAALEAALAERLELDASIIRSAFAGRRPE